MRRWILRLLQKPRSIDLGIAYLHASNAVTVSEVLRILPALCRDRQPDHRALSQSQSVLGRLKSLQQRHEVALLRLALTPRGSAYPLSHGKREGER